MVRPGRHGRAPGCGASRALGGGDWGIRRSGPDPARSQRTTSAPWTGVLLGPHGQRYGLLRTGERPGRPRVGAGRAAAAPGRALGRDRPVRVRMALHTGTAVFATANYDGVLGTGSFDTNGDTSLTTMSGRTVVNGRFDGNAVMLQAE